MLWFLAATGNLQAWFMKRAKLKFSNPQFVSDDTIIAMPLM